MWRDGKNPRKNVVNVSNEFNFVIEKTHSRVTKRKEFCFQTFNEGGFNLAHK
jgi:hypothetical protein